MDPWLYRLALENILHPHSWSFFQMAEGVHCLTEALRCCTTNPGAINSERSAPVHLRLVGETASCWDEKKCSW